MIKINNCYNIGFQDNIDNQQSNSNSLLKKALQKIPEDQRLAYMQQESKERTEIWKKATVVGSITGLIGLGIALKKNLKLSKNILYITDAFAVGFGATDIALMLYNKYKELNSK